MRSRHLIALAVAALVWLAPAGLAQASGSARKLLTKYQPVLVLHPDEVFHPTAVESFVHDSNLEAATGPETWTIVDPSPTADGLPTTSPPVWRLNQRACFAGAPLGDLACYAAGAAHEPGVTVYGRVGTGRARTSSSSTGSSTTTTCTATRSCRPERSGSRTRATGRS